MMNFVYPGGIRVILLGCNNGLGRGKFSNVKLLARKCEHGNGYFPSFLVFRPIRVRS